MRRFRATSVAAVAAFAVVTCVAGASASATASTTREKAARITSSSGSTNEAFTLYGDPDAAFATLRSLRVQALRVNLYWGGTQWAVATHTIRTRTQATSRRAFVPRGATSRRVQLGNLGVLLAELTRYYGDKHLWITEYGYQTSPPDPTILGTSWAKQALYLKQAYALARRNPRIDMMLWFLVRDQPQIGGWQSGLETIADRRRPAWTAFRDLPHAAEGLR